MASKSCWSYTSMKYYFITLTINIFFNPSTSKWSSLSILPYWVLYFVILYEFSKILSKAEGSILKSPREISYYFISSKIERSLTSASSSSLLEPFKFSIIFYRESWYWTIPLIHVNRAAIVWELFYILTWSHSGSSIIWHRFLI